MDVDASILIVDDEQAMRHMLRLVLEQAGYRVVEAETGLQGLDQLQKNGFRMVLCDIRMPEMDGEQFLREISSRGIDATIIMMSAYGSIDTAINCMKLGAYDYISKPFKPDEVVLTLKKAEERLRLRRENVQLKRQLASGRHEQELVYASPAMSRVMELVDRVADSGSTVLITGETGTGKELVARRLHDSSSRSDKPFVAVNCGAIAPNLLESELFGHARGAFTGANRHHEGLFGAADGGTLFLDEVSELPYELQPKLLRVLQEQEVRRVGETRPRSVDVRLVAATGRELRHEVDQGRFRNDLFFRLAVVEVALPPLRERPEDISVLVDHFLAVIARRERKVQPHLSDDAINEMKGYGWPGNVRELQNLMEKTMIFHRGGESISLDEIPWEVRRIERLAEDDYSLKQASRRLEKQYIRKALAATDGNRTQAARLLEISHRGLLNKMKLYDIS